MIKQVQALYDADKTLSNEQLAAALKAKTGLRLSECREWVAAWVLA